MGRNTLHILVAPLIFPLIFSVVCSTSKDLTNEQKHLLEKIKVAGEEAGLPTSALEATEKFDPNVCYEQECLDAALEILNKINLRVDPCDNEKWIQFVCRAEEAGSMGQMMELFRLVTNQSLELLTGDAFENSTDFLLPEARKYYKQCVNKSDSDRDDVRYILNITEKYGGWPMFTHRMPVQSLPWMEMVMDANRLEGNDFTPMFLRVSVPALELEIGKIAIPHTYQSVTDYKKLLIGMQRRGQLEDPVNTTQIGETLTFMTELNERIMTSIGSLDSHPKEEMSLSELQSKTDEYCLQKGVSWKVDWKSFLEGILAGTGIQLNDTYPVISLRFQPVMQLISLVEAEMSEASGRSAIANALCLNMATMLVQESTSLADNLKTFRCSEKSGERKELCFERTKEIFGYSLGKSYLKAYYNEVLTPRLFDILEKVREGYLQLIDTLEWMDNSTKEGLQDKINSTKVYAMQPEWLSAPGRLEQFYAGFPDFGIRAGDGSSYAQNFLEVNSWVVGKKRAWINKMMTLENPLELDLYELDAWNVYLGIAGAYYIYNNRIQINAGLLQKPIFSLNMPGFMVYGGLGSILAHELGHSLNEGSRYDKFGMPENYWDPASRDIYYKWVDEIANYYHSVPHRITDTMKPQVDPKIGGTVNEDIPDVLGVSVGFSAYSKYLEELEEGGGTEVVLPGLTSFSPQKLFFIRWGILWCDNPEVQLRFEYLTGPHSSGNRRASLPLMRVEQFRESFGCEGINSTENEIE